MDHLIERKNHTSHFQLFLTLLWVKVYLTQMIHYAYILPRSSMLITGNKDEIITEIVVVPLVPILPNRLIVCQQIRIVAIVIGIRTAFCATSTDNFNTIHNEDLGFVGTTANGSYRPRHLVLVHQQHGQERNFGKSRWETYRELIPTNQQKP